jgi:hypothetical protein
MHALWQQIAPGHPKPPTAWFQQLRQTFGDQVPIAAFQQFADQGKTLADLAHPDSYPRYLEACCRTAQQAPSASRNPGPSRRGCQPPAADDYDQDLAALYLAHRNRPNPAYDEDLAVLYQARREAHRSYPHPWPARAERRGS